MDDVLDFVPPALDRLEELELVPGRSCVDQIEENLSGGMDVVTDYSGTLQAENVAHWIFAGLRLRGRNIGQLTVHRSCDIDKACQKIAMATKWHPESPECREPCVMTDMRHRQNEFHVKIKALRLETRQRLGKKVAMKVKCRESQLFMAKVKEEIKKLPQEFFTSYESRGWCLRDRDWCVAAVADGGKTAPPPMGCHIAGVTCIGWSSRGARWGFLDNSFDEYLVYLIERLVMMWWEKYFVLECTKLFDYLFGLVIFFRGTHYVIVIDFCVSHTGISAGRHRRYVVCIRKLALSILDGLGNARELKATFVKLACSETIMSGTDFYCAPQNHCADQLEKMAQAFIFQFHILRINKHCL